MDTTLTRPRVEKLLLVGVNIALLSGLLCSQSVYVFAENIRIVNGIVAAPLVNNIRIEQSINSAVTEAASVKDFDQQIERKYRYGTIETVESGLKHIRLTKYYQGRPVKLNIIETDLTLNSDLKITPVIASNTLSRKASVTAMARKSNSIVAVNGAFFKPQTGCPLGTMMIDQKIYTGPIFNRVAMGFFDNGYDMAKVELNASLNYGFNSIKVNNINQPRMRAADMIVYTPDWGCRAPISPKYGSQIVVSDNKVVAIDSNYSDIPKDGYVLVGPACQFKGLKIGTRVNLDIKTIPEWKNVKHIVSGGPYLVKNGEVYVDIADQKLGSIGGRNPRTAIGYTKDNHVIIITADGREGSSVGMTLKELAYFMQSLGCVNAMNLDGGGSTVMYIKGHVVNHTPVRGGIQLSNIVGITKYR